MAGEHLAELEKWKSGMFPIDVEVSRDAWQTGASSIETVRTTLLTAAIEVTKGFGPGAEVSAMASQAFTAAAGRLDIQHKRMRSASRALTDVDTAMNAALKAETPSDPGPAPELPSTPGAVPSPVEVLKHAIDTAQHSAAVAAYSAADSDAKAKVEKLQTTYAEAVTVFTEIHGDPYVPAEPDGSSSGGSGPAGSPPAVPHSTTGTMPTHHTNGHLTHHHTTLIEVSDPTDPDRGDHGDQGDQGGDDSGTDSWPGPDLTLPDDGPGVSPVAVPGGTSSDSGGGGINPAVLGGGIAAGVFGAPLVAKGLSGVIGRQLGSASGGTIGSTARAGGPGALGRPGVAGGTGSRTGGAGAAGRGGAATAAGSRAGKGGGRGAAGERGAAAVGGRGGRKRDGQRDDVDQDLFDDGEGWLDDDGAAPGVLG